MKLRSEARQVCIVFLPKRTGQDLPKLIVNNQLAQSCFKVSCLFTMRNLLGTWPKESKQTAFLTTFLKSRVSWMFADDLSQSSKQTAENCLHFRIWGKASSRKLSECRTWLRQRPFTFPNQAWACWPIIHLSTKWVGFIGRNHSWPIKLRRRFSFKILLYCTIY